MSRALAALLETLRYVRLAWQLRREEDAHARMRAINEAMQRGEYH